MPPTRPVRTNKDPILSSSPKTPTPAIAPRNRPTRTGAVTTLKSKLSPEAQKHADRLAARAARAPIVVVESPADLRKVEKTRAQRQFPGPRTRAPIEAAESPEVDDPTEDAEAEADSELLEEVGENRSSNGSMFVRMLNTDGFVRPVKVDLVPDRMMDGYKFIVGEPAAPRLTGDLDKCIKDGTPNWYPRPRVTMHPGSLSNALRIWYNEMVKDRTAFRGNTDLDFGYAGQILSRIKTTSSGTGEATYDRPLEV